MELPDFERVYATEAPYVRRVLQGMGVRGPDLDDVLQDTFLIVYRLLPEFEGRSALQTWLYAVCWRRALAYHRRARTRESIPDADPGPASALGGNEGVARLLAGLDSVDPRCLDALALHEIGGLSISEVAELTGQARATVRRHVDRAKSSLLRGLVPIRRAKATETRFAARRAPLAPGPRRVDGVVHVSRNVYISREQGSVFTRWCGPCTNPELEIVFDIIADAVREADAPLTYLSIVEAHSDPPDRAGRDLIRRMINAYGPRFGAAAFVALRGRAFQILPPIINACVFLSRAKLDVRFFSREEPALAWLSRRADETTLRQLTWHAAHARRLHHPPEPELVAR